MQRSELKIVEKEQELVLRFVGELDLYALTEYEKRIAKVQMVPKRVIIDLLELRFLDTAAALFLLQIEQGFLSEDVCVAFRIKKQSLQETLHLVKSYTTSKKQLPQKSKKTALGLLGDSVWKNYRGFLDFLAFLGLLFYAKLQYLLSYKSIRYKEILFEMNESAIKALFIVSVTSFLIGVVVAYQSAYQLKIYGANIFIVDMLGLSILRELSPLITAIIIAGRSGSAYTAQIGAMKITEELDAMRTMGFDPFRFLVMPRIIALMIMMPVLIFISDMMALFGGMIVSSTYLDISSTLFIERFSTVIDIKHFFVGIVKGPFFGFLIASIAIHRGLRVQNDTQSIGINTTKSVVESIFAVIVCDAIFSIFFTNLGI